MALYIPGGAGFLPSTVPPAPSFVGPNRIQMDFVKSFVNPKSLQFSWQATHGETNHGMSHEMDVHG